MRSIGRSVNPDVNEELLNMAKDLRKLAGDIEAGNVAAVGLSAIVYDEDGDLCSSRYYTMRNGRFMLIGSLQVLVTHLSNVLQEEANAF